MYTYKDMDRIQMIEDQIKTAKAELERLNQLLHCTKLEIAYNEKLKEDLNGQQ